jgi:hypothetical protein
MKKISIKNAQKYVKEYQTRYDNIFQMTHPPQLTPDYPIAYFFKKEVIASNNSFFSIVENIKEWNYMIVYFGIDMEGTMVLIFCEGVKDNTTKTIKDGDSYYVSSNVNFPLENCPNLTNARTLSAMSSDAECCGGLCNPFCPETADGTTQLQLL